MKVNEIPKGAASGFRSFPVAPVAAAAVLASLSCPASADEPALPELEAGSSVFWSASTGGSADTFRERVVLTGDDWVLYQSIFDTEEDEAMSPDSLFLLYGGIDYRSCFDTPLPTEAERDAIKALRPFSEGATVELASLEDDPVVRVGAATEYFLMGQTHPAHEVLIDYGDEDLNEKLVVLDDYPLTVVIDWDDSSQDRVMMVSGAKTTKITPPTASQLGACAAILDEY